MAKASAGEMRLLSELRAKELSKVPNAEFAIIEREVQANGFKGIKGTTAQLVFNAIRKKDKAEKEVMKHGNHDQASHGAWANGKYNPDDSEGEDALEPKNYRPHPKFHSTKDDSEGEFEDNGADDPRWMDDMDILRPSRITPSQRYTTSAKELRDRLIAMKTSK